jgi:glycosyltransferase involved in cell wall biosynthesis
MAAQWQTRLSLDRRPRLVRIDPGSLAVKDGAWMILCLPVIEWSFRFQRPQQLMRQFARRGHHVFYAANHFHAGTEPRLCTIESGIDELILPGDVAANVYQSLPRAQDSTRMLEAIGSLVEKRGRLPFVIIVQLPYWSALAERLHRRFGWPIVYDCMDEHAGFLHNTPAVLEAEQRLIATSDLVIASSEQLFRKVELGARKTLLLRNACEYHHFAIPDRQAGSGPPVIGYYGAIAEWFDTALVEELARLRPGWRFELIGSTLACDVRALEDTPNVKLLGERPYTALPGLIAHWHVFIIPFQRVPLTEATNPVKVYEMLATGRPVVAVGLPELLPIAREGLITLADDARGFAAAIDELLVEIDPEIRNRRRAYAQTNTWEARHDSLSAVMAELITSTIPGHHLRMRACTAAGKDGGL